MLAGCVESNIQESTPTVTPTATPTAIPRATITSKMVPDIGKIERNDLGQRTYTKLTPEEAQELREVQDECPDCHHDYPYEKIIVEIEGELWWACQGLIEPEDELGNCTYIQKVTEKAILTKYGYMEQIT
jgi:hypothetical protein